MEVVESLLKEPLVLGVGASIGMFVGTSLLFSTTTSLIVSWIAWYSRPPDDPVEFKRRARNFPVHGERPIPELPAQDDQIVGRVTRWPFFCTGTLDYATPHSSSAAATPSVAPATAKVQCINVFGQWHVLNIKKC